MVVEAVGSGAQQWLVFLIGCCLGSFYNVVIQRLVRDQSLWRPGSHCPQCGKPVRWYDNVPVLSYIWLRGRCRDCGGRISWRYPIVELLAGGAAVALFRRYGWHPQFGVEFLFVSLLINIAFIDLDTFLIPDELSIGGVVAGILLAPLTPRIDLGTSLLGAAVGAGFFYGVERLYWLVRKREGLGLGDVKLLGMVGAFMGIPGVVFTVLAGSVAGTLGGVVAMIRSGLGLQTLIPFGPFLALGAVLYTFWGDMFFRWYLGGGWF